MKKKNYIILVILLCFGHNILLPMLQDDKEIKSKFINREFYLKRTLFEISSDYIINNNIGFNNEHTPIPNELKLYLSKIKDIKSRQMPKRIQDMFLNIINEVHWDSISKALLLVDKINESFNYEESNFLLNAIYYAVYKGLFNTNPWVAILIMLSEFTGRDFIKAELEELKNFCLSLSYKIDSDEYIILSHSIAPALYKLGIIPLPDLLKIYDQIIENASSEKLEYKSILLSQEIHNVMMSKNHDYTMIHKEFCKILDLALKENKDDILLLNLIVPVLDIEFLPIEYLKTDEMKKVIQYHVDNFLSGNNYYISYITCYYLIFICYEVLGSEQANKILDIIINKLVNDSDDSFLSYIGLIMQICSEYNQEHRIMDIKYIINDKCNRFRSLTGSIIKKSKNCI